MMPVDLLDLPQWNERECLGERLDRFYPKDGENWKRAKRRMADTATVLCAHCPILEQCRAAGASVKIPFGLWGGVAYHVDGAYNVTKYNVLVEGPKAKGVKLKGAEQ